MGDLPAFPDFLIVFSQAVFNASMTCCFVASETGLVRINENSAASGLRSICLTTSTSYLSPRGFVKFI